MRDYGKVHTSFWTSADTAELGDDGRMLALYLLTGPHTNQIGCFRLPDGYVMEDLCWSLERVSEGFQKLFDKGFATRDEGSKWVVIHKFLRWNEIENPNQAKAAVRLFEAVPDSSLVKSILARALRDFAPRFPVDVWKPFETLGEGLHQPFRNQEQEQEQEQEHITTTNVVVVDSQPAADLSIPAQGKQPKPAKPDCPHQAIVALYHELLPMCPGIREWTPARAQALRARWNEDPKRQDLGYWRKFFGYVAESDFLTGRSASAGRKPFLASLDWIVKSENFAKIREGRYHEQVAA